MCYKKQKKVMKDAFPSEESWNDYTLRNATSTILEYSSSHPSKEIF